MSVPAPEPASPQWVGFAPSTAETISGDGADSGMGPVLTPGAAVVPVGNGGSEESDPGSGAAPVSERFRHGERLTARGTVRCRGQLHSRGRRAIDRRAIPAPGAEPAPGAKSFSPRGQFRSRPGSAAEADLAADAGSCPASFPRLEPVPVRGAVPPTGPFSLPGQVPPLPPPIPLPGPDSGARSGSNTEKGRPFQREGVIPPLKPALPPSPVPEPGLFSPMGPIPALRVDSAAGGRYTAVKVRSAIRTRSNAGIGSAAWPVPARGAGNSGSEASSAADAIPGAWSVSVAGARYLRRDLLHCRSRHLPLPPAGAAAGAGF